MRSLLCFLFASLLTSSVHSADAGLLAGFAQVEISPKVGDKPVYLAGFGKNRLAKRVHDPLYARAVVLQHDKQKLALVSVDLVGFFLPNVEKVRSQLTDFTYVLVSATHNHEGPDTLGLWGPTVFKSGVDPDYLTFVEQKIVQAVQQAAKELQPVDVTLGSKPAPELLRDNREPIVKHDELLALHFLAKGTKKSVGLLVQWNCHPETLDDKNVEVSADFVGYTVTALQKKFGCPVAYFTGTVGGLMTSLQVEIKDAQGRLLQDGTFEKTQVFGERVAEVAVRALQDAKPISLTPFVVKQRKLFLPMSNQVYQIARTLGVLKREAYVWTGSTEKAEPAGANDGEKPLCLCTELGWLKLGDLEIAAIPGEIYPELVLDKVQTPADPGADFPDAPAEPAIYTQMKSAKKMLIGLANDEIGYIIPKRQWDVKAPYCYGKKKSQYGEINSVGHDTAPLLCEAFQALVKQGREPK